MINKNMRLGDLLVDAGLITAEQLTHVLSLQKSTGKKLGTLLIEENYVREDQIIEVLEFQLGIPHVDLEKYQVDTSSPRKISEKLARRYILIPIKEDREKLIVAMADPLNIFAIDDVKIATGLDVSPVIATKKDILNAIDKYYSGESAEQAIEDFRKEYQIENFEDFDDQELLELNNAPVVRLVNSIIQQAIKMKASDIHIEPKEKDLRIRFRVDGELQESMSISKSAHSAVVSRIKIMGNMNIAEKRIPQDGRVEMMFEESDIDMRISILPTVHGEKVVIRILDRNSFLFSKTQLGFSAHNLNIFDHIIKNPYGIILVTGPTGSGKTTTLYTALKELNQVNRNIVTIEDPVEYRLEGINQVQVNQKAGLTFASGLRSILRQDPDIVMIGEIRDAETAQIAVRAAITGHLVLSTIHTNDTISTITRLVDMGIEPYLVSSSVVGIMAQRLVKKICQNCKEVYEPTELEKRFLGEKALTTPIFKGKGCSKCNYTGYKGRQGVHEIVGVNEAMRVLIDERASIDKIKKVALEQGMVTLKDSCRELVLQGVTTIDELLRVAYTID